jgi:hypothetical protein
MERRIQRSRLNLKRVLRPTPDGLGDVVSVGRTGLERAEDQEIERALEKLEAFTRTFAHCVEMLLKIM